MAEQNSSVRASDGTALPATDAAADDVLVGDGPLEVAYTTFDSTPELGLPGISTGENPYIGEIQGPLETRVFALRQGQLCLGWSNSDFQAADSMRGILARALNIPREQTLDSETHNHCTVQSTKVFRDTSPGSFATRFLSHFEEAARTLPRKFRPANVAWGVEEVPNITYNRKGRRPDGSTYFMREEDRPDDFTGNIDPLAGIIGFHSPEGRSLLFLTHFTGHPVIAYRLESPVINPEYCGWAVRDLAAAYPEDRPATVFFQGCCGDINGKGMFKGAEVARRSGKILGAALIKASRNLTPIPRPVLAFTRGVAMVPYGPLPPVDQLRRERTELLEFQRRVDAGDPDTFNVIGYNFSKTMKLIQRRNLAAPLLQWTDWALEMHQAGNPRPQRFMPIKVQVVALGDIAIVTSQAELFVEIGLDIRRRSPYAMTLPVAYSNGTAPYYIGASRDVGDREYMSAFHRYAMSPPYAKPAGDVVADKAVELLNRVRANT